MKQINVKQAERLLERLKNENQQSYKDVSKFLRKYEKTEDQYECYLKVSHTLLSHFELTKELNMFLDDGNKFVVNRSEDDKIRELMAYVKKNRIETYNRIIEMINHISTESKSDNPDEKNKNLKDCLRQIIQGDEELEKITEKALDLTGQELINRMDLSHLKPKKSSQPEEEEEPEVSNTRNRPRQKVTRPPREEQKPKDFTVRFKPPAFNNLTTVSEERAAFKILEKSLPESIYGSIIKIVRIFYLNIITKAETLELLAQFGINDELENLRDMVEAREAERRKLSDFRPLNDLNFSSSQRASPSYVTLPFSYPIKCSNRTAELKRILNEKCVSVPHGSQENENFSVRNKNSNQINLLKAEDERYEFDIYMGRLAKTLDCLNKLLTDNVPNRAVLLKKVIDLGVIQLVYKNCHKQQKDEFEWHLKVSETETCRMLRDRISSQMQELKTIKDVYANKTWSQVAVKNFSKALDLKGFEFKKNEKQKMKGACFVADLQERMKMLQAGGESKSSQIPFQDKKEFFTILNSFLCSSRTERCTSRILPSLQEFDLKNEQRRRFYPVITMAFEDVGICKQVYSMLLYYVDTITQLNETEKSRCRLFLEQLLVGYFGWPMVTKKTLTDKFDQDKLYALISNSGEAINVDDWITEETEESLPYLMQTENDPKPICCLEGQPSRYSYEPFKTNGRKILYGSEQLYTLIRFIYTVYERLIRMREICEVSGKMRLFELLFFACIKAKDNLKFEENLNLLFNRHAYLFSTLYKLFDSLTKALSSVLTCPITLHGLLDLMKQPSQDIYFVKLNKLCLTGNLAHLKLIRLTFEENSKLLYVNYLESYYKAEDPFKQSLKKRADINKSIEYYSVEVQQSIDRKRKKTEMQEKSGMEYIFQGNTIKMLNHLQAEDLMVYVGRKLATGKMLRREVKRAHKIIERVA